MRSKLDIYLKYRNPKRWLYRACNDQIVGCTAVYN